MIFTVAGNATSGYSGDGNSATSAQLNYPEGVALDAAGNLYIADTSNDCIREVLNGLIATVAGNGTLGFSGDSGPAIGAQLTYPSGVALDSAGNLYIADNGNNRIRGVSSGVIATVAGGGSVLGASGPAASAQFWDPAGVAVDAAGNVYIVDTLDFLIRQVSSGVIATVAGNGTYGYSGDNGPATSAQLNYPEGVAVDAAGNLYIADAANSVIRQVSSGVIATVAGNGTPGYSGDSGPATSAELDDPEGVAVDAAGNLYIADSANNCIRKVSNGVITTVAGTGWPGYSGDNGPATSAQLSDPWGVAVDVSGNLYIADEGNNLIRKVSSGVITTVAGSGAYGYSGDNGPATSAQFDGPSAVAVDAAGNLYIADGFNGSIRKVSNGVITTVAGNGTTGFSGDGGPATSARLDDPQGVAVDVAGNVYAADSGNDRVRVLTPSGPSCSASATPTAFSPAGSGGSLAVVVKTSSPLCAWAIQSLPGWITFAGSAVATGPATVTLTVAANPGGARTGAVSVAGVSVAVNQAAVPVLSVSKTHTGSFTQGQSGATYTVTVSNGATAGPTSGTVTVAETPPSGLTVASMAGAGWTCGTTCTRSDVLAAGASYPAIAVTVNVKAAATSPQVNQVTVSGGGSASASATDSTVINPSGSSPQALRFVPMTPCRIADTRNIAGPFGGPSIAGGTSRDFNVPTSACSVPSTAQAYSLNVAVVPVGPLGYLTLWPTGQTQPLASTLNSLDGRIKSNAAIVPAGTAGSISVFASNATDVILDINGYFVPASVTTALAFYPITPCRIADTRTATATLGGPSLGGGSGRTFPIQSSACGLPATAQAYSLNFAAVPPGPLGYLTAWPTGQAMPLAASLNALTGTVTANAAIVPAGTAGSIDVFASNPTNLVIDVNGYFAPMATGGLSLYGVTPCRVLDTRLPSGSPPITSLDVAVSATACGIPSAAQADVLSVTVVPPGPLGYMTLWPQGQTMPVASTLNALDGSVTSNLAIVPTASGSISVFPSNPTHVVMDISGYFGQ